MSNESVASVSSSNEPVSVTISVVDLLNNRSAMIDGICEVWGEILGKSQSVNETDRAKANAIRIAISKFDSSHRSNLTELISILTGINLKESDYRIGDFVTILNKEGMHNYDVGSVARLAGVSSDGRWHADRTVSGNQGDNLKLTNFRPSTVDEVRTWLLAANSEQPDVRILSGILFGIDRRIG